MKKRMISVGEILISLGLIPLWFVKILSDMGIYKSSFSKYGTAYLISQGLIPDALAQEKEKV